MTARSISASGVKIAPASKAMLDFAHESSAQPPSVKSVHNFHRKRESLER